ARAASMDGCFSTRSLARWIASVRARILAILAWMPLEEEVILDPLPPLQLVGQLGEELRSFAAGFFIEPPTIHSRFLPLDSLLRHRYEEVVNSIRETGI